MKLKDLNICTYFLSRLERADQILATTDLGDRKPSALVKYLLTLLGTDGPEILLH